MGARGSEGILCVIGPILSQSRGVYQEMGFII